MAKKTKFQNIRNIGVFPKWSLTFTEFRENDNQISMKWVKFKVPVSHMCCAGAVVAFWPLTQEVAVGQVQVLLRIGIFFVNEFAEFSEKNLQTFRENPIRTCET